METAVLPHLQDHSLHFALFKNVTNASFLRQQLLDGNTDFEYAFLDASVLLSRRHIFAACFRAINDSLAGRMKSRNVHSEIVFSLSPTNNIAESFRRFGVTDTTTAIVAIKVGGDAEATAKHLLHAVQGEVSPLTDAKLADIRDEARIRKVYRLGPPRKGEDRGLNGEDELFVLGSMALKGS